MLDLRPRRMDPERDRKRHRQVGKERVAFDDVPRSVKAQRHAPVARHPLRAARRAVERPMMAIAGIVSRHVTLAFGRRKHNCR